MIITVLNFSTSKVDILKFSDKVAEQYNENYESLLADLDYHLSDIHYMVTDDLTANIFEADNNLHTKDTAKFIL